MVKHICCISFALLFFACVLSSATGASVRRQQRQFGIGKAADDVSVVGRQNDEVYNESEDSDEDDEEDVEADQEQQQAYAAAQQAQSDEDTDEDDDADDDDYIRRRRRDAAASGSESAHSNERPVAAVIEQAEAEAEAEAANKKQEQIAEIAEKEAEAEAEKEKEKETEKDTEKETEKDKEQATIAVSTTRKPVLVLIRDALKKVTTELPTEQVANNALQYFQLFEHFIQQTIEQVIGDDDDDEDETPAAAAAIGAEQGAETSDNKTPDEESATFQPSEQENIVEPKPEAVAEQPAIETPAVSEAAPVPVPAPAPEISANNV